MLAQQKELFYFCNPVSALGAAPSNPPGRKRSKGMKLSARCVSHLIFFQSIKMANAPDGGFAIFIIYQVAASDRL